MLDFLLGLISSFLGVGGGPINVAVFMFIFNIVYYPIKKAVEVYGQ